MHMDNLIGQSIGRYKIIEQLGQGGMATVFKAFDTRLEREVAIKLIRHDSISSQAMPIMLKRFEIEAKALARLSHYHIVKVHDYGEYSGAPYLVMEFFRGGSLKPGRMPFRQAAALLAPVADALHYAHQHGVVHRDVKPSNILIGETGQPVLSDFGIARLWEGQSSIKMTATGSVVGTPEYMSPEQWLGKPEPLTDVYSLGIVFYELVTGQKPYTANTPMAMMLKHLNDPLPRPRDLAPGLPAEVEQVILTALAKRPADRYADMAQFAAALKRLARPEQVQETQQQTANRPVITADLTGRGSEVQPPTLKRSWSIPTAPAFHLPRRVRKKRSTTREDTKTLLTAALVTIGLGGIGMLMVAAVALATNFLAAQGVYLQATQTAQATINSGKFGQAVLTAQAAKTLTSQAALGISPGPACTGIGQTWTSPVDGMAQVCVPAGGFLMGSTDADQEAISNEKPQHTVSLDAFWIDRSEVTNAQFAKCTAAGQCQAPSSASSSIHDSYFASRTYADYSVIFVDWNQANAYCQWAGRSLPSAAQWEKAARGTGGQLYPWGDSAPGQDLLNYHQNIGDAAKVGSFLKGASPYGALDMAGNVWEWVMDWYDENDYAGSTPSRNPTGPSSGQYREMRGGSWNSEAGSVRAALRFWNSPANRSNDIGFRCAYPE